ncbi:hypothetical protein RB195_007452 [Necator americanus]|uniref:Uncharacterized protein n=1 Tax=Necator americanus TaxID=51031 RepID=A0ABR1C137_NECAM
MSLRSTPVASSPKIGGTRSGEKHSAGGTNTRGNVMRKCWTRNDRCRDEATTKFVLAALFEQLPRFFRATLTVCPCGCN